ncbi:hypothetical protein DFP73DRAFT_488350, partial [Morchella snyderi]
STVIAIICAMYVTHLTNISADKKAWPIYLNIGNIMSSVRNKPHRAFIHSPRAAASTIKAGKEHNAS